MKKIILLSLFIIAGITALVFLSRAFFAPVEYSASLIDTIPPPPAIEIEKPVHIPTPSPLRGIYMTSWVAGTTDWRNKLVKMIDETELNSVIVDVKDYSGRIAFEIKNPVLQEAGAEEIRIPDIAEFIKFLHSKNIYAITRISVFQDAHLAKKRPDLAVKKKSGGIWKDYKGISWLNPASKEVWDYTILVAKEAE